jgi:hypothetical protein
MPNNYKNHTKNAKMINLLESRSMDNIGQRTGI